jgi:hypothetical protein
VRFGDAEPEDAWHPDDPVPVLLDNLARRCRALALRLPVDLEHRAEMIAEDLEFLRARIG